MVLVLVGVLVLLVLGETAAMGYYIDADGDPIETDDVPEDGDADLQPDFWTGPESRHQSPHPFGVCDDDECSRCWYPAG